MDWFQIHNQEELLSPALLFYPDRIKNNIASMIAIASNTKRLRPHIKTVKCAEIIKLQLDAGILKFKCATLSEAQLLAESGVKDILVAYPIVGPNKLAFINLIEKFSQVSFSVLIDDESELTEWKKLNTATNFFIDLDVGMGRTGIKPEHTLSLYQSIKNSNLLFKGLHAYDGHIHDTSIEKRTESVNKAFKSVEDLIESIKKEEQSNFEIVCGGSISFPVHATHQNRTLSPGTTVLWDRGYSQKYPDLDFEIAAIVLTRIISKPGLNKICIDLGHKAIASEMSDNRVYFPQIPNAKMIGHSEEHMVLEVENENDWNIGDTLYGIPWHICPTVALHKKAAVIINNRFESFWDIKARNRIYNL